VTRSRRRPPERSSDSGEEIMMFKAGRVSPCMYFGHSILTMRTAQ
jgi:hypothetical protein